MKLEDQVVNLELSKRLKELGVKQESLFSFYKGPLDNIYIDYFENICIHADYPPSEKICSSFTASELLEMLPDYLEEAGRLKIAKHDVKDEGITYFIEYGYGYHEQQDKNLSNALAKTLIHLIENKIIEV